MAEDEAGDLADQAFERWFQAALADPPEGVRRILRRRSKGQRPRELLRSALDRLIRCRDFPGPWRRDPFDRTGAHRRPRGAAEGAWARLQPKAPGPTITLPAISPRSRASSRRTTQLEAVRGRDYDGLEAALRDLARLRRAGAGRGQRRRRFGALSRDEVLARRDGVKADLDAFIAASDADLAPLLHEELQAAVAAYEDLKAKAGRLDFLDLLIKARDLIRDNESVRAELQQRFTHFFVDEFQDTDPLQAEILLLLAADDPAETDWRKAPPVPGKALPGRRSQAVDLPLPPRRRCAL